MHTVVLGSLWALRVCLCGQIQMHLAVCYPSHALSLLGCGFCFCMLLISWAWTAFPGAEIPSQTGLLLHAGEWPSTHLYGDTYLLYFHSHIPPTSGLIPLPIALTMHSHRWSSTPAFWHVSAVNVYYLYSLTILIQIRRSVYNSLLANSGFPHLGSAW